MIVHEFYIYCSKYSWLNKKMKNLSKYWKEFVSLS